MERRLRDFFKSRNNKEKKKEPQNFNEYRSQGIENKWSGFGYGIYAKGIPASYLYRR